MPSLSCPVERAKPLLGTIVRIRVEGLAAGLAHAAIGAAFRIVADIHRRMSFHDPDSELTLLNREAIRAPVTVSAHTRTVLEKALEMAQASSGLFDPTIARAQVHRGLLPAPDGQSPDPAASWKDIAVSADGAVSFGRPLWIDLGGIAKGYAVDCALAHIESYGPTRVCVEAGGDLRLAGRGVERVYLAAPKLSANLAVLEVEDAAVASSGSLPDSGVTGGLVSPHVDCRTGVPCRTDRFVTVVAPECMEADALTKVVMAAGVAASPILAAYQAQAFLFEGAGWSNLAEAA